MLARPKAVLNACVFGENTVNRDDNCEGRFLCTVLINAKIQVAFSDLSATCKSKRMSELSTSLDKLANLPEVFKTDRKSER